MCTWFKHYYTYFVIALKIYCNRNLNWSLSISVIKKVPYKNKQNLTYVLKSYFLIYWLMINETPLHYYRI